MACSWNETQRVPFFDNGTWRTTVELECTDCHDIKFVTAGGRLEGSNGFDPGGTQIPARNLPRPLADAR